MYIANITNQLQRFLYFLVSSDVMSCFVVDVISSDYTVDKPKPLPGRNSDIFQKKHLYKVFTDVTDVETNAVLDSSLKDAQPIRSSFSYSLWESHEALQFLDPWHQDLAKGSPRVVSTGSFDSPDFWHSHQLPLSPEKTCRAVYFALVRLSHWSSRQFRESGLADFRNWPILSHLLGASLSMNYWPQCLLVSAFAGIAKLFSYVPNIWGWRATKRPLHMQKEPISKGPALWMEDILAPHYGIVHPPLPTWCKNCGTV